MKLLKTRICNASLFQEDVEFDLTAQQRVSAENRQQLNQINDKIFTNPVIELTGINASGKSTTLKLIKLVFSILNGESLNSLADKRLYLELIGDRPISIQSFYFWKGDIYLLETKIGRRRSRKNPVDEELWICGEKLWKSRQGVSISKNNWRTESACPGNIYTSAAERKDAGDFLPDDTSINVAIAKKGRYSISYCDFLDTVDHNFFKVFGDYIPDVLHFLDPNIEYLKTKESDEGSRHEWILKFRNREKEYHLNSARELEFYLSSGTAKGVGLFSMAIIMFLEGGYILADELENHFNLKIVQCFLDLFFSRRTNRNGATIIFSTHYPELMDIPARNDAIYILSNDGKIQCQNLASLKNRNDGMKRSQAFIQNFLNTTTAPSYQSYMALKDLIETIELPADAEDQKELMDESAD